MNQWSLHGGPSNVVVVNHGHNSGTCVVQCTSEIVDFMEREESSTSMSKHLNDFDKCCSNAKWSSNGALWTSKELSCQLMLVLSDSLLKRKHVTKESSSLAIARIAVGAV